MKSAQSIPSSSPATGGRVDLIMRAPQLVAVLALGALVVAGCGAPPGTAVGTQPEANDTAAVTTDPEPDPYSLLPYPVVDTGQTTCFDESQPISCPTPGEALAGQDADYTGIAPSYRDNGDGTVTDLVTGLMWQQDPGDKMTYAAAVAGAESFRLAGYNDWRLPTIKELYSLIDFSGSDASACESLDHCEAVPFLDTTYFDFEYGDPTAGERVIDAQWATNTVYRGTTMGGNETMFGVNFADGRIKGYPIGSVGGTEKTYFVAYVRGNPAFGLNDFVSNGDGTVSDLATGLMWQQDDSRAGMDWPAALAYCSALEAGGNKDWRLPNAKEIQSIVDYGRSPSFTGSAAIDPVFETSPITREDGSAGYGFYWTGTTHATPQGGEYAVYVAFGEALGWMTLPGRGGLALLDVHGAGAQRSDPKVGSASDYPDGHGPQGDVVRIDNLARCVRDGGVTTPGL